MIIPRKSTGTIPGWHINNQKSDRFLITEFPNSAAPIKRCANEKQGTITAVYHAAWKIGETPPTGEKDISKGPNDPGIGRGTRVDQGYEEVARTIGEPREKIDVRYTKKKK